MMSLTKDGFPLAIASCSTERTLSFAKGIERRSLLTIPTVFGDDIAIGVILS